MDEPPTIAAVVPETIAAASPIAPGKKVALAATATVVTEASASAVVVDVVAAGSRLPAERDLPSLPSEREFSRLSSRDKLQTAILDVHRAVTVTQEIVKIAETARPMLKYLMLRSLGTGTHSTVHLIQRKRDARLLVMKRWTKTGPSALREAKLLQALHHPNIVRVHEHFVDPATAQLCIVMDYASGGDLQRRIDTAREAGEVIADEYALRVLVQLCLATAHIHARGIMHRDIKPANIFIAETPNRDSGGGGEVLCYLGDFSVSTQLAAGGGGGAGSLNLAQTITGTPYYLAPEIVRGEPYGVKSDMWAVGVVLYLMLTLELPFAASSLPALARLITDAEAQMPRERDAQLLQAVRMCLAKDAEARPAASAMLRLPAMQMMRKRYTSRKLRQATVSNLNLSPAVHVSPALNKQLSERESRSTSKTADSTQPSSAEEDSVLDALVVAELEDCMHAFGDVHYSEHSERAATSERELSESAGASGEVSSSAGAGAGARPAAKRNATLVERKLRTTSVYTDASQRAGRPAGRAGGPTPPVSPTGGRPAGSHGFAGEAPRPAPPSFDLALLFFSCANRGRAGKLYVTATHLAFIPILSGRRISIHLERLQCLVKCRAWALLPGEGRSLQVVLQPSLDEPAAKRSGGFSETFHGFWSRETVVETLLAATAARGMRLSVYKQRRLSVVNRKKPDMALVRRGSLSTAVRRVSQSAGLASPASVRGSTGNFWKRDSASAAVATSTANSPVPSPASPRSTRSHWSPAKRTPSPQASARTLVKAGSAGAGPR